MSFIIGGIIIALLYTVIRYSYSNREDNSPTHADVDADWSRYYPIGRYDIIKALVEKVKADAEVLVESSPYFSVDDIKEMNLVLDLLLQGAISGSINGIVLQAMHDVGMSAFKIYDGTPLEKSIGNLTGYLGRNVPVYRKLQPLRGYFSKFIEYYS